MFALTFVFLNAWVSAAPPDSPIAVDDVFLTLIADVSVPAPESGVLVEVVVKTGQSVKRGVLLARVDDSQAKLSETRASTELSRIRREAENDLKVQLAKKHHTAATAELQRALNTEKRLPKSVSDTEFDRLRLATEKAALEIAQEKFDVEMAQFAVKGSENDLRLAQMNVRRRRILAPLDGVVVEVRHRMGEWVEAGQPVIRIVQLDRLRAEGLLSADLANKDINGRAVRVDVRFGDNKTIAFDGKIVFVSPEIHPVNGKVQVWAEVENRDGLLRPGLSVTMTIVPEQP
jgi:macrolide-specific efflux system membrane fusion protein